MTITRGQLDNWESEVADLRARLAAAEGALPKDGPYSGRPILSIDWWLEQPSLEYDQNDVCLVGYDDLYNLTQALTTVTAERDAAVKDRNTAWAQAEARLAAGGYVPQDKLKAAEQENARLRAAFRQVDHLLRVPAAEYIPAIADVWSLIDAALQPATEDGR